MSFVSLADACRELGIDVKTLHRWLAEAQLPLQRHREDGRKKGVSLHHLEQLATRHHRSLSARPSAAPQPTGCLPTELLALPEQLADVQTQLAALQQQVGDLSRLIEPPAAPPAVTLSPTRDRSRPAAGTPRQPVHVLPRLEYAGQGRYIVIAAGKGVLSLSPRFARLVRLADEGLRLSLSRSAGILHRALRGDPGNPHRLASASQHPQSHLQPASGTHQ